MKFLNINYFIYTLLLNDLIYLNLISLIYNNYFDITIKNWVFHVHRIVCFIFKVIKPIHVKILIFVNWFVISR